VAPVSVLLELPAKQEPRRDDTDNPTELTFIDMEEFSAANKCACAASDDNPY
jgi:hypothetical protein